MIREAIAKVVEGIDLSEEEAIAVMEEIMTGEATPAQLGAFLIALRLKGETVDEVAGMARVMRAKANRVPADGLTLDIVGTGGDASGTFNASTAASFVAAGAGAHVAKHGNRAITSACGSADVLEALGARIDLSAEQTALCLERTGICFMFAPNFHPATRYAAGPRRELGIRTVFNILGPLTNPAGAQTQVVGVPRPDLVDFMAKVLARLGAQHVFVVHGTDGMDEFSVSAPSIVCEVSNGRLRSFTLEPEELGLRRYERTAVQGSSPADNAAMMRRILGGDDDQLALRDFVLLNAAAGLVAYGLATDLREGLRLGAETIDSGAALRKLDEFIAMTRSFEEASVA